MKQPYFVLAGFLLVVLMVACSNSNGGNIIFDGDPDGDSDGDTGDGDTDLEVDNETGDEGGDTDGDTESNEGSDSDSDEEATADGDADDEEATEEGDEDDDADDEEATEDGDEDVEDGDKEGEEDDDFEPTVVDISQSIHIQLAWNRSNTDLDVYLVRYRDEGTMGVYLPTVIRPQDPPQTACSPGALCPNDASGTPFPCGAGGYCTWECATDADCALVPDTLGLECATESGTCRKMDGTTIPCETAEDCGDFYCNPRSYNSQNSICTRYSWAAMNDCFGFYCGNGPCWTEDPDEIPPSDADRSAWPTLDIDDIYGPGPENMRVESPLPGRYRLVILSFNTGMDEDGPPPASEDNPVTGFVRVYPDGETGQVTEVTAQFQFTGAKQYWKVGDIVWHGHGDEGTGTFTTLPITGTGPVEEFETNPYANPFHSDSKLFDPNDPENPRSIWCDRPTDEYAPGATCAELYR